MLKRWVPDRRDVIWIDFDPKIGREMKARPPMLVLSPRIVNDPTRIVIGLPMSTPDYNATCRAPSNVRARNARRDGVRNSGARSRAGETSS